jgi:hypothetical protein
MQRVNVKMKQYFSKTKKRWMDFKVGDCEIKLKKSGYRIRPKPADLKEFRKLCRRMNENK